MKSLASNCLKLWAVKAGFQAVLGRRAVWKVTAILFVLLLSNLGKTTCPSREVFQSPWSWLPVHPPPTHTHQD